jgi:16S rRNA (cytidine1402-2'-O)-methyltransferase
MGILYLVATPLGNLKDLSQRSIEVLSNVSLIACEDTRVTSKLLFHLNIKTPTISYHEFNERTMAPKLIEELKNNDVALVSDAGYPLISDPGKVIISLAIENNIQIVPISGNTAFLHLLLASNFDLSHFYFHGFLKLDHVKEQLEELENLTCPIILYEAKHRLSATLKSLLQVFGNRKLVIGRELTKLHEQIIYTTLDEVQSLDLTVLGEFVLIVEGNTKQDKTSTDNEEIRSLITSLIAHNLSRKDVLDILQVYKSLSKNEISQLYNQIKLSYNEHQ